LLENKPFWTDVPVQVQKEVERKLRSTISSAERVLDNGRTIFVKGAGKGSTPVNWEAVSVEEEMYKTIQSISAFSPAYLGSVKTRDWHLVLLEDVSDAVEVPPWTKELAINAVQGIANFHVQGISEKEKVDSVLSKGYETSWRFLKENKAEREYFLTLFKDKRDKAESWFYEVIDTVIEAEEHVFDSEQPWGLIHFDIRSDNLRLRNGKIVLFDWALLCNGPLVLDIMLFFPSVLGEGGPSAEILFPEYKAIMEKNGIIFPDFTVLAAAAFTAGFFAARAGKEPIPILPRLRSNQRMQLGPALWWMTKIMNLPDPPCIDFKEGSVASK
jgi:hypothetical protein